MTDAELIERSHGILMRWLIPEPGPDDEETLLQLIELYKQSGRGFIAGFTYMDAPAND